MYKFTIEANKCLKQSVNGYYHGSYYKGNWQIAGTLENLLTTLKNDIPPYQSITDLKYANKRLTQILKEDLANFPTKELTICVVPRAKKEDHYNSNQLWFKATVRKVIKEMGFHDGIDYILRHTNTRTTHRDKSGYGGDGDRPYSGITQNTCTISSEVSGKDILLIDDIYTKTINVDEDAIQALLDHGARSVIFYAVGKTESSYYNSSTAWLSEAISLGW